MGINIPTKAANSGQDIITYASLSDRPTAANFGIGKNIVSTATYTIECVSDGTEYYSQGHSASLADRPSAATFGKGVWQVGHKAYSCDGVAFTPLASNNHDGRIMFSAVGDSITSAIGTVSSTTDRCWHLYTSLMSGGKIGYIRGNGGGGYTTAQIKDSILPAFLSYPAAKKPTHMGILGGTNDVSQGIATATILSNVTSMIHSCRDAGIEPIVFALTPRVDLVSGVVKLNLAYEKLCRELGVAFIDWYSALVEPSTGAWKAGYNITADNVHPENVGHRAMGTFAAAAIIDIFKPRLLPFVRDNVANDCAANGLFLTDSNADGLPNGASYRYGSGNVTNALIPSTIGNEYQVTLSNTSGWEGRLPALSSVAEGDILEIGFIVTTTGMSSGSFGITIVKTGSYTDIISSTARITENVTDYTHFERVTVPAGYTAVDVNFAQSGVNAGATISFKQYTMRNLTALGLV